MTDHGLKKNAEGYSDPTAYAAIKNIMTEEQEEQRQLSALVHCLKYIIRLAGFELVGRVELRHIKSGRTYK